MNSVDTPAFKKVFESTALNDGLYFFLQLIYRQYPEDAFHYIIALAIKEKKTDEEIYKEVLKGLPEIKPFLQWLNYTLPGIQKTRKELRRQLQRVLNNTKEINGYLEAGSKGNYLKAIPKGIKIKGHVNVMDDVVPAPSIKGMMERGRFGKAGHFIPLNYNAVSTIHPESIDVATCYEGLHHCPEDRLNEFITGIHRVLRPGGFFILREYDVKTPDMQMFADIIHTVMSAATNIPWKQQAQELRNFRPAEEWSNIICSYGFEDLGYRILQEKDPTINTLMVFRKG